MANSAGSKKRARQAIKNNSNNSRLRTKVRTYIKKTLNAIDKKDKSLATETFIIMQKVIDQVVAKGLIHKNNAARKKHRINAKLKGL